MPCTVRQLLPSDGLSTPYRGTRGVSIPCAASLHDASGTCRKCLASATVLTEVFYEKQLKVRFRCHNMTFTSPLGEGGVSMARDISFEFLCRCGTGLTLKLNQLLDMAGGDIMPCVSKANSLNPRWPRSTGTRTCED
jgi:hypothetical protein